MYFFHKRVKKVKRPPTWNQAVSCGEDITHCLLFVLGLFAMAVTWAVNLGTKLEKFSLLNADKKWSCPFEHWVRHQADQWLQSNLYLEAQSFGSQILEWSYSKVFAWTTELPKKSFYSWHSRDSYSQYFKWRQDLGFWECQCVYLSLHCPSSMLEISSHPNLLFANFFLFLIWIFQHAGMKDTHLEFWQIKMQPLCNLSSSIPRIHQTF